VTAKLSAKEKKAAEEKAALEGFQPALKLARCDEAAYFERRKHYESMSGATLSALLKHNGQLSSGSKLQQAVRCAEFSELGSLPRCPHCTKNVLRFSPDLSEIARQPILVCPGRVESESGQPFVACECIIKEADCPRRPWAAIDEPAPEAPAAGAAAAAGGSQREQALASLAASDLSELKGAVAAVLAAAETMHLSLPKDKTQRSTEVAGLLAAHKAGGVFDAKAALEKLAGKYPVAAKGFTALVEANEPLAVAFDGLAAQVADEPFKRKTWVLASQAVRCWPGEVKKGKELTAGARKVKGLGASVEKLIDRFIKSGAFGEAD